MAPYLSLLPLRREKPKLPPSAATPPSPANLDRFFADSPAPPTRTSTATHGRPAASHAMDESIVDFGELLQSSGDGGFDMLNDGDLPSFWAEDSLLVLPGASDGKGKTKAKEAIQEHSAEKLAPRKETPSESQQQQADSAEQSKLNRRTSLARLPIPIPLLSAPPAAHPAAIPVPSRRQSLARPAHILPAHHPAHPRPLALSSHPTTVPAAPSHSTSLHSISTSYANPSNPSSEASIFKPLTTSTPLPVSRPERRQSLAAPTFSPILSLPSPAANPDDMFARRARDSDLHKGIELKIQEEVEVGVGGMTSTPRVERGVKFALPEMEEGISVIFEEKDEDEEEAVEQGPTMEPVVELEAPPQRRRASRAFLALPASDPFVTSSSEAISASATQPSTARRASRAFKFPAPPSQTPSAAPTRVLATSAPAPTPLSRSVEPPLSIIRLIVPHSTRPLAESGKSRTTAARATSTKKKTPAAVAGPVLTLPRDFSFGARAAEREEEKKKRAEEREREKLAKAKEVQVRAKRKAVSGWGVPAGEKRQKFATSLPAARPAPPLATLHSSAPASAPIPAFIRPTYQPRSRPRRSSLAGPGAALTKEALEASVAVVGPKIDLERRVSRYIEGISEGADEEGDHVEVVVAPKVKVAKVAAPARRPLQATEAHNKPRPLSTSHPAPTKKPLSAPQPFTFSAPRLPPTHLQTWQARERIPLARPMPIFEDPVPFAKRPRVAIESTDLGLRTEKRRAERESWETRQREREEENRRLKEVQRARKEEEERIKLKALRDGLIVKAHPVPKWILERKAALKGE